MSIEASIKKKFSGFALDVEFHNEGRMLGILGASGSGKSMTLKCIAGVETPDAGRITVNGRVLFDSEKKINLPPQKRHIGYLFQNYALFPTMTVEENIGIGIKEPKQVKRQLTAEKIREFRLEGLERRYPWELSGGQQQRVALARMLVCKPDVIMLDEPFSALDSFLKETLQQQLMQTLRDYRGDVILVTHNRDEVYRFCEKLMVISGGKVAASGDTKALFQNPENVEAAKLTGCKNISEVRKIDSHTIEAVRWGILLTTAEPVSDRIRYVGIRAHDLVPMWEKPDGNGIPYNLSGRVSLPFEEHFFLKTAGGEEDAQVCWFASKDRAAELEKKGTPLYLEMPGDKLLLLE